MKRNFINRLIWRFITVIRYRAMFNKVGNHTTIFQPLQLDEVSSIGIESNVCIARGAWLYGNKSVKRTLTIMDGTNIGHFVHIIAHHNISIENDVLIADRVFISDCTHSYENIDIPILRQSVQNLSPVIVGKGSWLGENVCVCGASVGKHCVIGANSVVTEDIPDYCVAVGSPAKVVKKYDFESNGWKRVSDT